MINHKTRSSNLMISLRGLLLALVPILGIYIAFPGVTYDIVVLLIFMTIDCMYRQRFSFNKTLLIYFSIILLIGLFSFIFSFYQVESIYYHNTLQIIFFAAIISYYTEQRINKMFIKVLLVIGILSTFFAFYQAIAYWVFHKSVTLFLPINKDIPVSTIVSIDYGRPNSFFTEPAHYAIFILPLLYYALLKRNYWLSTFFTVGLITSTSTTGIAGGIIIILYCIVSNKRIRAAIITILSLALLFIYLGIIHISDTSAFEKLTLLNLQDNSRILGTLPVFHKMNAYSLFFGLGHNQLEGFMARKGMEFAGNYANSFFMSIFSFGLLGLMALLVLLYKLFKENSNKGYFFILLIVMVSDQILFNRNFFYLITCIYFLKDESLMVMVYGRKERSKAYKQGGRYPAVLHAG